MYVDTEVYSWVKSRISRELSDWLHFSNIVYIKVIWVKSTTTAQSMYALTKISLNALMWLIFRMVFIIV